MAATPKKENLGLEEAESKEHLGGDLAATGSVTVASKKKKEEEGKKVGCNNECNDHSFRDLEELERKTV